MQKIIWTKTDEAPALAGYSLLPIVRSFLREAGIEIDLFDISLAGRILAAFPHCLTRDQQVPDHLEELGRRVKLDRTNIIKLPNISASIPQLQAAIKELQEKGYKIPDYPPAPETSEQKEIQTRYAKVLGSAVNPVLREGNSDRRAPVSVKSFARKNPHKMMKAWPDSGSGARVAHMTEKDFFGTETSLTLDRPCTVRIEFKALDGETTLLKKDLSLTEGEVVDTAVMNIKALRDFYAREMDNAKKEGGLLSLHLKATMMKVSDPIMFGHCVSVFFRDVLEKHATALESVGANVNNGLADILDKLKALPRETREEIQREIQAVYEQRPDLAMVDSDKGITNLHLPNNVIVDASMPNIIRDGGRMWNRDGKLQDTVAMIPDRSYATMYQAVIEDCKAHGQFDPASMGSVSNVGLMAKKAEEYGSHDKTFEAEAKGTIQIVDEQGRCLLSQEVDQGDIFRMCQTRDIALQDWVRLGIARAKATDSPAVFWLDPERGHDREIRKKVLEFLPKHDKTGLDIRLLPPDKAMAFTLERVRRGEDTISVTGNVLRDYLTDLFPILELGTSSRMLSIVPLLKGGGLFETGAGGSAPKHVDQFLKEGHLRWDSLGEYCALVPSLELAANADKNEKAGILARALDRAIGNYLEQGKTPSRKVNEPDNRGASFYIALFWAEALAGQSDDQDMKRKFSGVAQQLRENETRIAKELLEAQGEPVDIGGYFQPDPAKTESRMRPSQILNKIIDGL
ncbi:NADP-dependent isocitrate dehydrogenase [Desulfospira joergensenii]|uniref:NADP-dependent isocitrate dehydrogenase n=1 Tax=Desulfospira joergensenii TaxID=53329 RepID=UPI0003B522BA|nr:NADP-dependent isocitrate dehydrogenase [Desulfospira joergensenii]